MAQKDAGSFWDEEREPHVISKNDRGDEIHVRRVRRGRSWYCDVRNFYRDKETGEMRPAKGIAIPNDLADEVAEAIIATGKKR